jgi:hypothetical protein
MCAWKKYQAYIKSLEEYNTTSPYSLLPLSDAAPPEILRTAQASALVSTESFIRDLDS